MIKLVKQGGLGNNLWQYCTTRLVAEKLGISMSNTPIPYFPSTSEVIRGKKYFVKRRKLFGHFMPDQWTGYHSTVYSNFERFEYIAEDLEKVMRWATPTNFGKPHGYLIGSEDLGISIRRGFMNWPTEELCPEYDYYQKLLSKFSFRKLYLFTDSPEDSYFDNMKKDFGKEMIVVDASPIEQYALIGTLKRYICAPSTFSFWASVAGQCEEVYWPKIKALDFTNTNQNWFPESLKNHRYIE